MKVVNLLPLLPLFCATLAQIDDPGNQSVFRNEESLKNTKLGDEKSLTKRGIRFHVGEIGRPKQTNFETRSRFANENNLLNNQMILRRLALDSEDMVGAAKEDEISGEHDTMANFQRLRNMMQSFQDSRDPNQNNPATSTTSNQEALLQSINTDLLNNPQIAPEITDSGSIIDPKLGTLGSLWVHSPQQQLEAGKKSAEFLKSYLGQTKSAEVNQNEFLPQNVLPHKHLHEHTKHHVAEHELSNQGKFKHGKKHKFGHETGNLGNGVQGFEYETSGFGGQGVHIPQNNFEPGFSTGFLRQGSEDPMFFEEIQASDEDEETNILDTSGEPDDAFTEQEDEDRDAERKSTAKSAGESFNKKIPPPKKSLQNAKKILDEENLPETMKQVENLKSNPKKITETHTTLTVDKDDIILGNQKKSEESQGKLSSHETDKGNIEEKVGAGNPQIAQGKLFLPHIGLGQGLSHGIVRPGLGIGNHGIGGLGLGHGLGFGHGHGGLGHGLHHGFVGSERRSFEDPVSRENLAHDIDTINEATSHHNDPENIRAGDDNPQSQDSNSKSFLPTFGLGGGHGGRGLGGGRGLSGGHGIGGGHGSSGGHGSGGGGGGFGHGISNGGFGHGFGHRGLGHGIGNGGSGHRGLGHGIGNGGFGGGIGNGGFGNGAGSFGQGGFGQGFSRSDKQSSDEPISRESFTHDIETSQQNGPDNVRAGDDNPQNQNADSKSFSPTFGLGNGIDGGHDIGEFGHGFANGGFGHGIGSFGHGSGGFGHGFSQDHFGHGFVGADRQSFEDFNSKENNNNDSGNEHFNQQSESNIDSQSDQNPGPQGKTFFGHGLGGFGHGIRPGFGGFGHGNGGFGNGFGGFGHGGFGHGGFGHGGFGHGFSSGPFGNGFFRSSEVNNADLEDSKDEKPEEPAIISLKLPSITIAPKIPDVKEILSQEIDMMNEGIEDIEARLSEANLLNEQLLHGQELNTQKFGDGTEEMDHNNGITVGLIREVEESNQTKSKEEALPQEIIEGHTPTEVMEDTTMSLPLLHSDTLESRSGTVGDSKMLKEAEEEPLINPAAIDLSRELFLRVNSSADRARHILVVDHPVKTPPLIFPQFYISETGPVVSMALNETNNTSSEINENIISGESTDTEVTSPASLTTTIINEEDLGPLTTTATSQEDLLTTTAANQEDLLTTTASNQEDPLTTAVTIEEDLITTVISILEDPSNQTEVDTLDEICSDNLKENKTDPIFSSGSSAEFHQGLDNSIAINRTEAEVVSLKEPSSQERVIEKLGGEKLDPSYVFSAYQNEQASSSGEVSSNDEVKKVEETSKPLETRSRSSTLACRRRRAFGPP